MRRAWHPPFHLKVIIRFAGKPPNPLLPTFLAASTWASRDVKVDLVDPAVQPHARRVAK